MRHLAAAGLIALLGLLAYANCFHVPFHFDDQHAILDNPRIRSLEDLPSLFTDIEGSIASRPLTLATFSLNYALGELDPFGYHVVNVFLHLANALLLYLVVLAAGTRRGHDGRAVRATALLGGLFMALHPLHTETVTYVVSRSELLSTFFMLSGILLLDRAAGAQGRTRLLLAALILPVGLLGMASRENFGLFPFILLLYDRMFLKDRSPGPWPHVAAFSSLAYLAYLLMNYDSGEHAGFGVLAHTQAEYTLSALRVQWTYLRLLLLPINLTPDYDYPVTASLADPSVLAGLLGSVGLWAAALGALRRAPAVSFCLLWFLLLLLPAAAVPVVDVMFEHRVYMASAGPLVLAAMFFWRARPDA